MGLYEKQSLVNGYQELIANLFFICSQSVSFVCFVSASVPALWQAGGLIEIIIKRKHIYALHRRFIPSGLSILIMPLVCIRYRNTTVACMGDGT
jgi:hypothetical protein